MAGDAAATLLHLMKMPDLELLIPVAAAAVLHFMGMVALVGLELW